MVEIQAEILHQGAQQEQRRADRHHEQHQQDGNDQIQLGQPPDAAIGAAQHRQGRCAHDQHDQPDLDRRRVRHRIFIGQTRRNLRHAEAQRRRDAEHGAADREDVDRIT